MSMAFETSSREPRDDKSACELTDEPSDMDELESMRSESLQTPKHSNGTKHRAGGDSGNKFALSCNSHMTKNPGRNWESTPSVDSSSIISSSSLNPLSPIFIPSQYLVDSSRCSNSTLVRTPVRSTPVPGDGLRRSFPSPTFIEKSAKSKDGKFCYKSECSLQDHDEENVAVNVDEFPRPVRSPKMLSEPATYPLIHVSNAGAISVVLSADVVVETTVDRSIRVVCHNKFSAYVSSRGASSSILHTQSCIVHNKEAVFCKFMSSNDKMAVFGKEGVLFSMGHLSEAFLVRTNHRGATAVPLDHQLHFPMLDGDYTMRLFYTESKNGSKMIPLCREIVDEATYRRVNGLLTMNINGMVIRYSCEGELEVDARPRHISCDTKLGTVRVRSNAIDMGIQSPEQAFVKFGLKRVHVSRSGMVVAEGNSSTSMDHFGRIVSCT